MPTLTIGVTGDYPPLTIYDEKHNSYTGFDIDMAQSLGAYLHRDICFVKTTWSHLAEDLAAHRFDIAMGGVSITQARAQDFLFTDTVLTDEKCAVFLCSAKQHYTSLATIDKPQITVIENKGGTNEQFAREHLQQANIKIYADNTTIFNQLLNGSGDVMITDAIEAHYQQKLHPELCILQFVTHAMSEHKAYMLRKEDGELQQQLNQWLKQMRNSREFMQLKNKWL